MYASATAASGQKPFHEGHLSVPLNGVDNVEKTTQLAWLCRGVPGAHLVGTVDSWDSRWREAASGDFAHWWFVGSTTVEHVGLMLGSMPPVALAAGGWPWRTGDCRCFGPPARPRLSSRTVCRRPTRCGWWIALPPTFRPLCLAGKCTYCYGRSSLGGGIGEFPLFREFNRSSRRTCSSSAALASRN
ncbi:MAG: hypothetical protein ACRDQ7_01490 [Haloechinothrix sp.]